MINKTTWTELNISAIWRIHSCKKRLLKHCIPSQLSPIGTRAYTFQTVWPRVTRDYVNARARGWTAFYFTVLKTETKCRKFVHPLRESFNEMDSLYLKKTHKFFFPEEGGSRFPWNASSNPAHYIPSYPRWLQYELLKSTIQLHYIYILNSYQGVNKCRPDYKNKSVINLLNNQLDAQFFLVRLFLFSTCFGKPCAYHQENYCINATPGLCHSV